MVDVFIEPVFFRWHCILELRGNRRSFTSQKYGLETDSEHEMQVYNYYTFLVKKFIEHSRYAACLYLTFCKA